MKASISGKEISNNIRAERNRNKLTQKEVADRLGITVRTYLKYEEDAENIKATTLYVLSKLFMCNISDFYVSNNFTKCEEN